MTDTLKQFKMAALCAALLLANSACITLGVGAVTESGVVVAQERTVGNAIDDATILTKIKEKYLQKDINDLLPGVEIKVIEGRVLLAGSVKKPDTQIDAVRLAWQVEGVREVINEIQISDQSGFGNYAQDVWISTQIRSRMLFASNIRSVNYSVITVNQTVYLMGIAQDRDELARALQVARTTDYVKQVISHVRLKNDPRRKPEA